jgi:hypothetical protein
MEHPSKPFLKSQGGDLIFDVTTAAMAYQLKTGTLLDYTQKVQKLYSYVFNLEMEVEHLRRYEWGY